MIIADLPCKDDEAAIFDFAISFDGYVEFGSFDASADAAASGDRSTLRLVRNELFFAARSSRQTGDSVLTDIYRDLLPLLRSFADGS